MKPFAAVILAAGLCRRMGQFKPLMTIGNKTFVDLLIAKFLTSGIDVYVVVGHRRQELITALKNQHVTIVENPDYEKGMFTSVQAGVRSLQPGYEAFFIMPVDIPLIRPASIRHLLKAYRGHSGKIIYPVFRQQRGHPPLIPMSLALMITGFRQDGNLKDILASCGDLALEVTLPDENILLDIDTPEEYRLLHNSTN